MFIFIQYSETSKSANLFLELFDSRLNNIESMIDSKNAKIPYDNYYEIEMDGTVKDTSAVNLKNKKLTSYLLFSYISNLKLNEVKVIICPDIADGVQRINFAKRYTNSIVLYSFDPGSFFPEFLLNNLNFILETNGENWYSNSSKLIEDNYGRSLIQLKSGSLYMTVSKDMKNINNSSISIIQNISFQTVIYLIFALVLLITLSILNHQMQKIIRNFKLLKNEQQYLDGFINTLCENIVSQNVEASIIPDIMNTVYNDALQYDKEEKLEFEEIMQHRNLINKFICEILRLLDTLKRQQTKLIESEGRFRAIFEQAPVGISIVNASTREYSEVNKKFCDILGFSESELLKESYRNLTHPDDLVLNEKYLKLLLLGEVPAFTYEKRVYKGDSSIAWITLTCVALKNFKYNRFDRYLTLIQDITDKKLVEIDLVKTKTYLTRLFESTSELIFVVDPEKFGLLTFNSAFSRYLLDKLNIDVRQGLTPYDILPERLDKEWIEMYKHTLKVGTYEVEYSPNDANSVILSMSFNLLESNGEIIGISVFGNDITEKKSSENEIRKLNSLLSQQLKETELASTNLTSLLDNSKDLIWAVDEELKIKIFNRAMYEHMLESYGHKISKGASILDCIPEDIKSFWEDVYKKVVENGAFSFEYKAPKVCKFLKVYVTPVFDENGLVCISVYANDVTELKERENEIMRLNNALEKKVLDRTIELEVKNASLKWEIEQRRILEKELKIAKIKAEEASNYKSQFVANMSHELRTPINAIIGFNHLLGNTNLSTKQKEYLEKSIMSSQNLISIVNNILDFSKIEANKIELEHIPFSLAVLFNNLDSMLISEAKDKGLSLEFEVSKDIPAVLIGDPTRIYQILMNLITNSIKFTETGNVFVKAYLDSYEEDKAKILFKVADTGIGMTAEHTEKIFSPFTQADSSTTREFGGTGLGLSICKQLVELMGGKINVESTYGEGSVFTVEIDFNYSNSIDKVVLESSIQPDSIKLEDKRVLLVEDNDINQFIFTELLQSRGIIVDRAENGLEAVNKIENGFEYDLILMDVHMPVLNGYDASKRIRAFGCNIPIIAITADAVKGVKQKVLESGMNGYISKPINPEHMILAIQKFIEKDQNIEYNAGAAVQQFLSRTSTDSTLYELPPRLPGLNIKDGLIRLGGKLSNYLHILKLFNDKSINTNEAIEDYLADNDVSTAIRTAHSLKGISATIGAYKVSESAEKIQKALESKVPEIDLKAELEIIKQELAVVRESINECLNQKSR